MLGAPAFHFCFPGEVQDLFANVRTDEKPAPGQKKKLVTVSSEFVAQLKVLMETVPPRDAREAVSILMGQEELHGLDQE